MKVLSVCFPCLMQDSPLARVRNFHACQLDIGALGQQCEPQDAGQNTQADVESRHPYPLKVKYPDEDTTKHHPKSAEQY